MHLVQILLVPVECHSEVLLRLLHIVFPKVYLADIIQDSKVYLCHCPIAALKAVVVPSIWGY